MSKDIDRRLGRLEEMASPGRIISALDTEDNRALVHCGFVPDPPGAPPRPDMRQRKRLQAWLDGHRRLEKRDIIVFLSEPEMRL